MLQNIFFRLCSAHCLDKNLIKADWKEILQYYSSTKRYYHNMQHLLQVVQELQPVMSILNDADACLFAVFYHDIIYDPFADDNEFRSAAVAIKRMKEMGIAENTITACSEMILATKGHLPNAKTDTNYFTDADLSMLGKNQEVYLIYSNLIRKEYSSVPDVGYIAGRRKLLEHFLKMERIFKTEYFFLKYEKQARINIATELESPEHI